MDQRAPEWHFQNTHGAICGKVHGSTVLMNNLKSHVTERHRLRHLEKMIKDQIKYLGTVVRKELKSLKFGTARLSGEKLVANS